MREDPCAHEGDTSDSPGKDGSLYSFLLEPAFTYWSLFMLPCWKPHTNVIGGISQRLYERPNISRNEASVVMKSARRSGRRMKY
jgi:hypothetical protein